MKTILVVDDEDDLRSMVSRVLTGQGYEVLEAGDGLKAAHVCAQRQPDLMIADLIMPDGEGLELIKMLRHTYERLKIIAMTGGGRGGKTNYLFMAESLGADYTMEKPFSAQHLLSIDRLAIGPEPASPAIEIG